MVNVFMNNRFKSYQGFSLVELLVAMAIIGVIASIGMPMYTEQMNKGRRVEARDILRDIAFEITALRTTPAQSYAAASLAGEGVRGALDPSFYLPPARVAQNYSFEVVYTDAPYTFTIYALPLSGTPGARMEGDGPMLLRHTGQFGWAPGQPNGAPDTDFTEDRL